jgi:hypothetical protein
MSTFLQEQLSMQRSREIILKITETCWDQCISADGKVTTSHDLRPTFCCHPALPFIISSCVVCSLSNGRRRVDS